MSDSAERLRRQREMRALIRETPIASQAALARAMKRLGFPVTQATLSRDLKEMRILRMPTEGGYRYAEAGGGAPDAPADAAEARRLASVASLEITGIDANESCVIVRTLAGRAPGAAVWLDGLALPDVLATVAGDDTILVLPRSVRRTARLRLALEALLAP